MSSLTRSKLSRIENESRDLLAPIRTWLDLLCSEPRQHGRFLNTLSLMEHIGSRKIMVSQDVPRQDTLKHLAEETRHAFFFKRAAERLAKRSLEYELPDMLAGDSARQYMGRLDAHIAGSLPRRAAPEAAYLYMSLIVELRAIWFYRLYQEVLAARCIDLSLKSVIAEEELHLDEMERRLSALDPERERHGEEFCGYERERFRLLWSAFRTHTHAPALAAS